tara:strand:+ start:381 stop:752 length:372 start_codon:yes stop_codon:yes gene_type:complete
MEYTGFELQLSDYEKGFLTAYFEAHLRFEDYKAEKVAFPIPYLWYEHLDDDQEWIGVSIGNRMFDICIWLDTDFPEYPDEAPTYPDHLVACVYECDKTDDDNWTTNTDTCWFLKEVEKGQSHD